MNPNESSVTVAELTDLSREVESAMLEVESCCSPPDSDRLPGLFLSLREKLDRLDQSVEGASEIDTAQPDADALRCVFIGLRQTNRRIGVLLELWRHHTDQALSLLGPASDDCYGAQGLHERQLAARHLGTG